MPLACNRTGLSLISSIKTVAANEISHIVVGDENLVTTSETNFALATPSLSSSTKWKT